MSLSKIRVNNLSQEETNKLLSEAWLNIQVDDKNLFNPLAKIPPSFEERPEMYYTWLLMQPEYFTFLCREILNLDIWPMQGVIMQQLWNHKFPLLIGSRGLSKSFTLAIYALLRMLLFPGRKLIITGAAFRQSKIIFEYMENIWDNAPLLRDMCRSSGKYGPERGNDMWNFRIGASITRAIPMGTGDKIRGLRANDTIVDEFSSIVREIFETVILGFSAVKANPVDALKKEAAKRLARILKVKYDDEEEDSYLKDNQTIISGTAYYDFNHFAEYWKRWRSIILSEGNKHEMERIFNGPVPKSISWEDFCIMRIPFELIPTGFMEEAQVARSRASMHSGIYNMEFGAVFEKDSQGFFKRMLVESCVCSIANNIHINGDFIKFTPVLVGDKKAQYVMAVDPASEVDNFSIVILELCGTHKKIRYCWTTDKKDYKERHASGLCKDGDFYSFCTRKIRSLLRQFNCIGIGIDAQGGGHQIISALANPDLMEPGEVPIWEAIDYENPKDSDSQYGLHIIHAIQFADADWTHKANHGLRADFESKMCLFPYNDAVDIAIAMSESELTGSIYDTLEDVIFEIEELKNELATIVMTRTPTGKDKFDTPEIKLAGSRKGRMRKDRYSSLLIANAVANLVGSIAPKPEYSIEAGWAQPIDSSQLKGKLFNGPQWVEALNDIYD